MADEFEGLRKLFGLLRSKPSDPMDDARRLAALLMIEARLYDHAALESLRPGEPLPGAVAASLARALETFDEQTNGSAEAREVFLREAIEAIGAEHAEAVSAALRAAPTSGPRPLRPR